MAIDIWHLALGGILLAGALWWFARVFERRNHPLAITCRSTLRLLLPSGLLLGYLHFIVQVPVQSRAMRIVETVFWISAIWVVLSLTRVVLHERRGQTTWRSRVPGLFIDLFRFTFVGVGALLVVALVWEGNLTGAFATLGVGSLVLGLALQDTLGNLMAGIALLFERPFQVGDWIRVGETVGEVVEMNWRAVRVQTRALDVVVIPNSVLGKERIENYSRPTPTHGVEFEVAFSHRDPPNKIKRMLEDCARMTVDVSPHGISVRVKKFLDSSILYGVRVFTERFDRLNEVQSDFMTHVWYATRRAGIIIPYPVRTVYRTEVPAPSPGDPVADRQASLARVPIFAPLSPEELTTLAEGTGLVEFAAGETIIVQGEEGDTLFIVRRGRVVVSVESGNDKTAHPVAELGVGEFFGEVAVLTGGRRHATVVAVDDTELVSVPKSALEPVIENRPGLVAQFAEIIAARKDGLEAATDRPVHPLPTKPSDGEEPVPLLSVIKRFFGLT